MMFGRPVRTRWDLLKPDTHAKVLQNQERMIGRENRTRQARALTAVSKVWVRDFTDRQKWVPGVVISNTGPLSYRVQVEGQVLRRHVDHLLVRRALEGRHQLNEYPDQDTRADLDAEATGPDQPGRLPDSEPEEREQRPCATMEGDGGSAEETPLPPEPEPAVREEEDCPRRSCRTRRAPEKMNL